MAVLRLVLDYSVVIHSKGKEDIVVPQGVYLVAHSTGGEYEFNRISKALSTFGFWYGDEPKEILLPMLESR